MKLTTDPGWTTYTLPVGNYSGTSLATALTTLTGYTWTYTSYTLKLAVTHTSSIDYSYSQSTANRVLGIVQDKSGLAITADGTIDLAGARSVHISVDVVNTQNRESFLGGSFSSVIAKVPVFASPGALLSYTPSVPLWSEVDGLEMSTFQVELLDEDGYTIDMNYSDWEITLAIIFIKVRDVDPSPLSYQSQLTGEHEDPFETGTKRARV